MATGKITKRTLDALQAGAVTGFLWDDELKGVRTQDYRGRLCVLCRPVSDGWPRGEERVATPSAVMARHGRPSPLARRRRDSSASSPKGSTPSRSDKQRRREAVDLAFSNYADRFAADCKGKGWSTLVTRSLHLHVKPVLRDKALPTITRIDVVTVFDRMPADQAANRRNVFAVLEAPISMGGESWRHRQKPDGRHGNAESG